MTHSLLGPPPAGLNPQLWTWFKAVDTDGSGQLTVHELQRALVNGDWSPFNIETVRTMVNMFDKGTKECVRRRDTSNSPTLGAFFFFFSTADNTGTIGFDEFTGLWNYIEEWKRCFQTFDRDGSGSVDRQELRAALQAFGFNVSDTFVSNLIQKFDRYGK